MNIENKITLNEKVAKVALSTLQVSIITALVCLYSTFATFASSHREAPLIANDPLADNTDVYAFVSPDDSNMVTIIANYIPVQLPHGGPNYYSFGENINYEIHIVNDPNSNSDDITYRFTFTKSNDDPSTFFNIRLGEENLKNRYTVSKKIGTGPFNEIVANGVVPPPNIGPRSIEDPVLGLGTTYEELIEGAIENATGGGNEKFFCGSADDPFFVDLGGIFDLGDAPRQNGAPRDGLSCFNTHAIAIQVPIATLQKDGKMVSQRADILDPEFIIGVWASASRPAMRTLNGDGTESYSGSQVQISRLGMPLTNEAVIPIKDKDRWNAMTPYQEASSQEFYEYFYNPELALYMDTAEFAAAVPAFDPLRVQENSLQSFDFTNGADGLFPVKGDPSTDGTAFDTSGLYADLLLPGPGQPRSADLWPIFHTGVPNLAPYQLATGKDRNNPFSAGKPFINNFLPNGGDMLRLNMAVPATDRDDAAFSSKGLIAAAEAGLTDPAYANTNLEFIPNMDGFPNGRRLEDDVTRIELQAVGGVVLAAIGLFYDDYDTATTPTGITPDLSNVLGYSTGVEENDAEFKSEFPYVAMPWRGTGSCGGKAIFYNQPDILDPTGTPPPTTGLLGLSAPEALITVFPNPVNNTSSVKLNLRKAGNLVVAVYDLQGRQVEVLSKGNKIPGQYNFTWDAKNVQSGVYLINAHIDGVPVAFTRVVKSNN